MSFEAEQAGERPPQPGCCCFWQSTAGDGAQETSNPVAEARRTIAIITGKAGSGKDTLASHIGEHHGLPTISYSNILRYPLSPFEKELSAQGVHTHTDEQIMQLITRRAETDECRDGFLLVNFPRRPGQMAALEEWLQEADENVSTVVYLDVPEEVIIERVSNRLVHSASGRTYHTKLHPPKVLKPIPLDDETGEPLDRRPEDTPEEVRHKLSKFEAWSGPMLQHLQETGRRVDFIDATHPMDKVCSDVEKVLELVVEKRPPRSPEYLSALDAHRSLHDGVDALELSTHHHHLLHEV